MAAENNDIPGVFNYCDAWCARCPFTSRCANFAMGEEIRRLEKSGAQEKAKFWRELEERIDEALANVEEDLFNVNAPDMNPEYAFEEEPRCAKVQDHPCAATAYSYISMADAWFKAADFRFDKTSGCERPANAAAKERFPYDDAVEVIRWYQRFIYVKIVRALRGALDEQKFELDPQGDENGSAKVALIGTDRSLASWNMLLKAFPEQKSRTIPVMAE